MNIGFLSTGLSQQIFDLHILGYLERKDIRINALCDKTTEKAKYRVKHLNLGDSLNFYTDYKKMIDDENLDILEVLLPPPFHAEATIYAAKKNINAISVESPMAASIKEADKMIEVCKNNNVFLSIYENSLFSSHIKEAKKLIENDYIGDIASIRIKVAIGMKHDNKEKEIGKWENTEKNTIVAYPSLFDTGSNAFSLARWLINEEIVKVFAWTGEYSNVEAPIFVNWKFQRKEEHVVPKYGNMELALMPNIEIPSKYFPMDEFIEIIGSRGLMKINQCSSIGNKMKDSPVFKPLVIVRDGKVEVSNKFQKDWKYNFINATNYFIEAFKTNKEPILSGKDGKNILKFYLAAIKSAQTKKDVYLEELN